MDSSVKTKWLEAMPAKPVNVPKYAADLRLAAWLTLCRFLDANGGMSAFNVSEHVSGPRTLRCADFIGFNPATGQTALMGYDWSALHKRT